MNAHRHGGIVVGVDETALAGQAVRWAADQARLEGRHLLLVNASGPVAASWADRAMSTPNGAFAGYQRRGAELLARAEAEVLRTFPDADVEQRFVVSDPRTLLVEVSADAHLVVLGSRGRGPALSHLLGSVGLAVVRHATCPVVVHRPGHPGRVHNGVLVAVEAEAGSVPILEAAYRMASLRRLPLRVVHFVFDARSVLVGSPMVGDVREQEESETAVVAEAMAGLGEQYPDVRVKVEVLHGLPEHAVVREAARADLLVIGTHQRGLLGRLLTGSVSESVVEHAACPVLVVPPSLRADGGRVDSGGAAAPTDRGDPGTGD